MDEERVRKARPSSKYIVFNLTPGSAATAREARRGPQARSSVATLRWARAPDAPKCRPSAARAAEPRRANPRRLRHGGALGARPPRRCRPVSAALEVAPARPKGRWRNRRQSPWECRCVGLDPPEDTSLRSRRAHPQRSATKVRLSLLTVATLHRPVLVLEDE